MLTGHLLVIGVVFLVAVAAIARIVAGTVAGTVRVVAVSIRIVLSMARVVIVALVLPSLVAILVIQAVVACDIQLGWRQRRRRTLWSASGNELRKRGVRD